VHVACAPSIQSQTDPVQLLEPGLQIGFGRHVVSSEAILYNPAGWRMDRLLRKLGHFEQLVEFGVVCLIEGNIPRDKELQGLLIGTLISMGHRFGC
jgi:hypothetical protein